MYVILVGTDNSLTTTNKERIMQRSKLVDNLWFLVHPIYKEYDMSNCTVMLEYILPVSRKYKTEILVKSDEMYEDHLKYVLPFDTDLTSEAGKIEAQLTFYNVDLDVNGKSLQQVRKTSTTTIEIVPISAWSDIIPDSALGALDQRIIKQDAQIKALEYYTEVLAQVQVDNLVYDSDDETLQLMAGENVIGDKVSVRDMIDDGIPVVDLDSSGDNGDAEHEEGCTCGCEDNVVEFGYSSDDGNETGNETVADDDNVVEF